MRFILALMLFSGAATAAVPCDTIGDRCYPELGAQFTQTYVDAAKVVDSGLAEQMNAKGERAFFLSFMKEPNPTRGFYRFTFKFINGRLHVDEGMVPVATSMLKAMK